jgi:butyryl-CoA dehydrogenase
MPFILTEEQELMVNVAKEFAATEIRPEIPKIEQSQFPQQLMDRMFELGFRNMLIPEEFGGLGESMVSHLLITEEIAKESFVMAICGTTNTIGEILVEVANDEQKARLLPKYVAGGHIAGFGFTEPGAGSDAGGIQATAVKDGDYWVLNGQKTFISYINACDAFLVSARTNETGKGGISTFLVEKSLPGFQIGSIFHKLGMRGSDTGEIFLKDVRVEAKNQIGPENKGLGVVLKVLDKARLSTAASAVGIAEGALAKAVDFIKERVQFGQSIASFQGIQWYVAEMQASILAARALVYESARAFDNNQAGAGALSAAAKLVATETAVKVSEQAVQLCGGYGLIDDFGLERYYRDAKVTKILEGTSEILKIVVARSVLH